MYIITHVLVGRYLYLGNFPPPHFLFFVSGHYFDEVDFLEIQVSGYLGTYFSFCVGRKV